jgi:hypothetical protein
MELKAQIRELESTIKTMQQNFSIENITNAFKSVLQDAMAQSLLS